MLIRPYTLNDAATLAKLFYDAIHQLTTAHYTEAQRKAWAPTIPDPTLFHQRLTARHTFVAESNYIILGFLSLEPTGYIDMLYRSPTSTGLGVATQLHRRTVEQALTLHLTQLTTHASLTAWPFFQHHGYTIQSEETIERNGITLPRLFLIKQL